MGFIKFQTFEEKKSKLADFWPKHGPLGSFPQPDFISSEKVINVFKNALIWLKLVNLLLIIRLTNVTMGFGIFLVLVNLCGLKLPRWQFL